MSKKLTIVLLLLTVVALMGVPAALALPAYKDDFNAKYNTTGTRIDQCILCHVNANPFSDSTRNSYGIDLDNQLVNLTSTPSNANQSTVNQSLTNIEPLDSDGDGFINIDEIHNLTFPGNASDHPTIVTPTPVLTTITVSPSTATLNVNGTQVFTATALDQNNTPMAGTNISWTVSNSTVGNISTLNAVTDMNGTATTTFMALAVGNAMVNATNGTVSGNATVNVTANVTAPTPKLTLTLNNTMDGTSPPLVNNFTGAVAVLLDTSGNTVATATFPDNITAQFNLSGISPGDYFIEVNGLAGDHLPTRIDSNASDINQTVGKRLRNSVIGDIANPTYRIKVYPSGNPPVVNSSHPVVNYATGANETKYNYVIVPGSINEIEVRVLNTSEKLSNFTSPSGTHPAGANFSSEPFQIWILGDIKNSTGAFIGNHGHLYNNTDSNCNTCHGNLDTKASNFSDITLNNGWCFRCHYGKTGPRNGFVDPTVVVAANGTIAGNVTNASSGSAISGATVTANGMMATTDANGSYNISIAAGTYNVTASATGYQSNTTTGVVVTSGNVTTQNFALTPAVALPALTTITVSPSTATLNVNGTQVFTATALDQNNTPMQGINISWTSSNTTVGNVSALNSITDVNGSATTTFTALAVGNAMVNATNGTVFGSANVTVVTVQLLGSISGTKFNDLNGNGSRDAGEPGLANWTIILTMPDGSVENTTTNADGLYIFGNLSAGNYSIEEFIPPGWFRTFPSVPFRNITLSAGKNLTNIDFGNKQTVPPATFNISGFKINGTNNNGMGLENWNILLLNPETNAEIANTTTDRMGFYQFMNLSNGSYNVTEKMKTGWTNISPTSQIVIINGTDMTGVNFTNSLILPTPPKTTFNISGFKLNGATGDGIQGWIISAKNATTGVPIFNTTTDTTGFYMIPNLTNGTYTVVEEIRSGFTPNGSTSQNITIAGQDVMNVNFTNTPTPTLLGSISGTKFNDLNGNGSRDAGEPGLANWTIVLTMPDGSMENTTTNADGLYIFGNLPAGNYSIEEVIPPGWFRTFPSAPFRNITLSVGENLTNINFGNKQIIQPTRFNISGFKINGTNNNGMGLENWNIMLINPDTGAEIASTMTDSMGFYMFTGLPNGTYNVTEGMKEGWMNVSPISRIVTINGMDEMNVNFTNTLRPTPPSVTNTISGFKINDLNGNGRRDAGEEGLPGWNIRLIGIVPETAGINTEKTTDDRGFYSFENLPAGMYIVVETLKGGYVPTGSPVIVVNLENGTNSMNNNFMNRPVSSLIPDLSGMFR